MITTTELKQIAMTAFAYIDHVNNSIDINDIDTTVENFIFKQIKKVTTDIKIVSEEYGTFILGTPKQTLIIDPIDGSGNLIRGIPIYSVAIALCNGCLDEAGVDEIEYSVVVSTFGVYEASKEDAVVEQKLGPISVSEALIRCTRPFRMRLLGASSVELCLLASGSIDGFIERKGLKSVDLLPVLRILERNGCYFCDKFGEELRFGLSNPKEDCYSIVVARSKELLEELLNEIKE